MRQIFNKTWQGLQLRGSFVRNITVYTTGAFFAHVIGLLFTPVITRIYTPEDYGKFALFSTVLALVSSLSSFSYTDALILPKKDNDFYKLSRVILILSFGIGSIFIIFLVFAGEFFLTFYNLQDLRFVLYLIPFLVIINSFQFIADNYNVRNKKFAKNAKSKLVSVSTGKSIVVILGYYIGSTVYGLISGEFIIRFINTLSLLGKDIYRFTSRLLVWDGLKEHIRIIKEYKSYPKYIFPSSILLQISIHLPVFIIGKLYNTETLGYYTLAMSLLGIPIQIIGFTIGKVFLQKANETMKTNNWMELKIQFLNLFYAVTFLVAVGYGVIFGFGPGIFDFIAGNNWRQAGEIARLLAMGLSLQLIGTVIGPLFRVVRKENILFYINIIGSGIIIAILAFASLAGLNSKIFIILLSAGIFIRYLILIAVALKILNLNVLKHIFFPIIILVFFFSTYFFISALIN